MKPIATQEYAKESPRQIPGISLNPSPGRLPGKILPNPDLQQLLTSLPKPEPELSPKS
jgi:hypothetical protein